MGRKVRDLSLQRRFPAAGCDLCCTILCERVGETELYDFDESLQPLVPEAFRENVGVSVGGGRRTEITLARTNLHVKKNVRQHFVERL